MQNVKRNWKTTIAGVVALLGTVAYVLDAVANGKPLDFQFIITSLTGAFVSLGLIAAKDSDKTGVITKAVPPAAVLLLAGALLFAAPARAQDSTPTGILPQAGACFADGAACLQPAVTVVPIVIDFRGGDISHDAAFSFGYGLVFAHMLNESFRPGVDFLGGTQTGGGWNAAILGRLGVLRLGPVLTHKPGVMYAGMGVGVGM